MIDVKNEITPIHGDSYVFVLKHPGAEIKNTVADTIKKEDNEGRHNPNFYKMFGMNARKIVEQLKFYFNLTKYQLEKKSRIV